MKVIDLFCGCGGSTLGAKMAGAEVTDAYDWDREAIASYHFNHPEVRMHKRNILELNAEDLPAGADILMGSTPCESFSVANRTSRTCDMQLTLKFLELVRDYRPRFWVMENVPPVAQHLPAGTPHQILNAADYGTAQLRKRLMAGNYPEPARTNSDEPFDLLPRYKRFKYIRDIDRRNWQFLSLQAIRGLFKRQQAMALHGLHFNARIIGDDDVPFTFLASEYHGVRAGVVVVYEGGGPSPPRETRARSTHLSGPQSRFQGHFPRENTNTTIGKGGNSRPRGALVSDLPAVRLAQSEPHGVLPALRARGGRAPPAAVAASISSQDRTGRTDCPRGGNGGIEDGL